MGASLSYQAVYEDPPGPGDGVTFFRTLKLKWVTLFFNKIRELGLSEFNIDAGLDSKKAEKLKWIDYFRIFTEIKEKMEHDDEVLSRANWHPTCTGFIMRSGLLPDYVDASLEVVRSKTIPDDHTDDDASSDEEDEEEEEEGEDEDDDDEVEDIDDKSSKEEAKANGGLDEQGSDRGASRSESAKSNKSEQADNNGEGGDGDGKAEVPETEEEVGASGKELQQQKKKQNPPRVKRRNSWMANETDSKPNSAARNKRVRKVDLEGERQRKKWDASTCSPIFFGYHHTTVSMLQQEKMQEKEKNADAETRAIARAKESRLSLLDQVQKSVKSQETARLKKIEEIDRRYEAARSRREEELNKNRKDLPEGPFKTFKKQWDSEYDAAEAAYEAEVGNLRYIHHTKSLVDDANLTKKREEMEAFKDAEAQEMPAAERLEEIARIEIARWIDQLDTCSSELEKARLAFTEMREELELLQEKIRNSNNSGNSKKHEKQLRELRSVVNHSESMVREAQKALEDALVALEDAEALFDRAIRIKHQQDQLLPLFALLANEAHPSSCPLDLFACSMTIFMNGSFEQKVNFFFTLFDVFGEGYFSSAFIFRALVLFQETLFRLKMLPYEPRIDETQSFVMRAFLDLGLKPSSPGSSNADCLTQFEVRQVIAALIGHSQQLSVALGFSTAGLGRGSKLSTYQRNRMSATALMIRGITNPTSARYRVHYEMTKYWPQLAPKAKQRTHELALAMGDGDPLKADYTRFMAKNKKKFQSTIPPLDHGHLLYAKFVENRIREEAVTKIQAMVRAHNDRALAELAARRQAFLDAKAMAMAEMKAKVVKEFKKREAQTGMGKMKWDAQVRMKQAKIRATGITQTRPEVVMLMMEEAIQKAKLDIEARFVKLEEKEGFTGVVVEKRKNAYLDNALAGQDADFVTAFGLQVKASVDQSALADDAPVSGPSAANLARAYEESSTVSGNQLESEQPEADEKEPETQLILGGIDKHRARLTVEGKYRFDPTAKGETSLETDMRLAMMRPEPETAYFFSRLRALNNAVTVFKTAGIVAELPSKRLLLRYVDSMSIEALTKELRVHFRFTRSMHQIALLLRSISSSDLERGILLEDVVHLQDRIEPGLRELVRAEMGRMVDILEITLDRRLKTNETASEEHLMRLEKERADKYVNKFRSEVEVVLGTIEQQRLLFRRLMMSVLEMEKKQRAVNLLQDRRSNEGKGMRDPEVIIEDRQSWIKRLKTADRLPDITQAKAEIKYAEIRTVCREFLDVATADAMIILAEHHQPKIRKTILVTGEMDVNGRSKECGRGMGGKFFTYEAHNITYVVAEDYHGIFNGSDEFAAKYAGKDRLGALEYFKAHTPKLNLPLVATVDFGGYRVLCVAKLPTEIVSFNDEGEVRKVLEDQVHGTIKAGEAFINKNKTCNNLLRSVSLRLNLAEHSCRGTKDAHTSVTFCSADIQIFRGADDEFYLQGFSRAFPPEFPEATPHLPRAARDQSIFWRHLRPEFCRRYEEEPLSPDAFCVIVQRAPDRDSQNAAVEKATHFLVKTVIPEFAIALSSRTYSMPLSEALGMDITAEMHCRGINMRHLGLLRSLLWRQLPGTISVFYNEKRMRTTADLRSDVIHGDTVRIQELGDFVVTEDRSDKEHVGIITNNSLPLPALYLGKSKKDVIARAGSIPIDKNSDELRCLLLAEMIARTMKNIIRLQLRNYARKSGVISAQFISATIVERLNVVTGAHPQSNYILQEVVYEALRDRFGPLAVRASERLNLQEVIRPCIIYIVRRIVSMLGAHVQASCLADFLERPLAFSFCDMDLLQVAPVVCHNIPIMAFSDAKLVTLKAQEASELTYFKQVLIDKPSVFLRMYERKGARTAENKGSLGTEYDGFYSKGCEQWLDGPIATDPFSRAIGCSVEAESYVDVKFHAQIVPANVHDQFTVEVFCRCTGGADTMRVVMMSGRYGIAASKDGFYTFMFMDGTSEVNIRMCPVVMNKWTHLMITYDGTTLKCYCDAQISVSTEVDEPLKLRQAGFEMEIKENNEKLNEEEAAERGVVKTTTQKQAEAYFVSKQGIAWLKTETVDVMESAEFQALNIGIDSDEQTAIREKRAAALKQAKARYTSDLYVKNVKDIAERFKLLRDELEDKINKRNDEGFLRVRTPLRIGATPPSVHSRKAEHIFVGEIACLSVYTTCLSLDRVRAHGVSATSDRTRDAQRLYATAAMKYEEALALAPDDVQMLTGFAHSLTEYLKIEVNGSNMQGISKGKLKVIEAIDKFKAIGVADGAAAILMALPREAEYAALACKAFTAVKEIDKKFFTRGLNMERKDLVYLPHSFGLDYPGNPQEYIHAAAAMYKEVVRDSSLSFAYGETELGFITDIECSELVIALVRHAREDKSLKMVKVGELFKAVGREKINVNDDDVSTLAGNSLLSIGFDFAGCSQLTNQTLISLSRTTNLRILGLENCSLIDDRGLRYLLDIAERLEVINLSGVMQITDEGLAPLFSACQRLSIVNVSKCPQITFELLHLLAVNNKKLCTLHASGTKITDGGLSLIMSAVSPKWMTSLDISMCRDISDYGTMSIGDSAPGLKYLNLSGLSRVSDSGTRAICSKCWFLETLNLEDVFLLDDEAFHFSQTYDGRPLAKENMLKSLSTLNLRDCVNLTNHGVQGLAMRCRKLETLILRGCDKLSDLALRYIADPFEDNFPLCDSLRVLDVSHCSGITAQGISAILPHCGVLEEILVSGITSISDEFVHQLCTTCPTMQRITMQRCVFVSDAALCSIADYLWLEHLDISGCHRITDDGIEVLSVSCNGIFRLLCKRVHKLTAKSIYSISRNCRTIQQLDVSECPLIREKSIADLKTFKNNLNVIV